MSRPLRARINLQSLRHNYQLACKCAPNGKAVAVVKANAYGHGALMCARALSDMAPAYAVASIEEAMVLREGGIKQPIVLLEGFFSADELPLIAANNIWTAVHSEWQINAIGRSNLSSPIHIWLKFDSGMHRLGLDADQIVKAWQCLSASEKVADLHLMTHFATADSQDDHRFKYQQAQVDQLTQRLSDMGHEVPRSLANSPATLKQVISAEWYRPGLMLYGADPLEHSNALSRQLQPVMTLESEIIALRDVPVGEPVGYGGRFVADKPTRIAVVACGYGDGYDRHAREGTPVLVEGERAYVAGRVSMDMMTIDVTHLPTVALGDKVTLWGVSLQGAVLDINEVASCCDTINYTLMTGVMARVPRIPVGE
ncbi:Alanine racemase [Halomonadaceae bacterium LMG 33818]|uniref:alanine racemase n=1 Tax=Cernens ardua TaxID=3402176 RepID=UPI003EDC3F14